MKKILCTILFSIAINLVAQAESDIDYKIADIKITPFDSKTGEFQETLKQKAIEPYFNAISTSLFVIVEVSGKAGIFESKKKVEIQIFEGKKKKANKIEKNMLFGDNGKFFIPLLLEPLMCKDIKITARILGQKTDSSLTKIIPFQCGE